jgi:hypothetical protein
MGNTFGHLFRITTFGESHGGGVGVVIDGCPPRLEISAEEIQRELDRRRPGQSKITTPRKEADTCEILSGVFEGKTLGTPIAILVRNKDTRPRIMMKCNKRIALPMRMRLMMPNMAFATGKVGDGLQHGRQLDEWQRVRSLKKFFNKSLVSKLLATSSGLKI